MIKRHLYETILANTTKQKVGILLGARRVGKTALLKKIRENYPGKCLWLNGEDQNVANILEERSVANYRRLAGEYSLLIVDEAQHIPEIGRKVKMMSDELPGLHIIITGSSAFDVEQASEPLVGRTITYRMYPVSQSELSTQENLLQTQENLAERLIFGSYPETITLPTLPEKQAYLAELVNIYLLKEILSFEKARNPQKIRNLLILLAFQIGSEVSSEELGRKLSLSKNTVERYLDLLAKSFVIYRRGSFSRNLRKEISKGNKWFFFDNGVRNALIGNFNLLGGRQDVGMLWENYITAERLKYNSYGGRHAESFFWRTYDQQEIDLIESDANRLHAFEFKWKAEKSKIPVAFANAYPEAEFSVIHQTNYLDFITGESKD